MVTETEARFKAKLREAEELVANSKLTVKDAERLIYYCENMLLRYQEIQTSRENWKQNYLTLRKSITNPDESSEVQQNGN